MREVYSDLASYLSSPTLPKLIQSYLILSINVPYIDNYHPKSLQRHVVNSQRVQYWLYLCQLLTTQCLSQPSKSTKVSTPGFTLLRRRST